jgi:hypothetical protein
MHFGTRWAPTKSSTYRLLEQNELQGSVLELKHQCAPSFHSPNKVDTLELSLSVAPDNQWKAPQYKREFHATVVSQF